ncbi:3-oxoacyl-[acyl-carrier-protein] synthase, mitochondrial-like isoform X2 [Paramacrobiotus metropolitanus]|uniref:3-oxoacyl-[acyl-carrier-protein] synthase, mitochondrial-like isoform X2 n=1 Tax=Paramacrobiotus metropolitanus TaxID=2943436 RepID=UPI002445799A|nr:3-oxoacyl-[acyl-carrier-protein] synthase, mitochondrial-like isoform X2 [Paramacrobiotus metropolitanus]
MRRVVVTGLGIVSPLGCSVESAWRKLLNGCVGIQRLSSPEYANVPCKVAAPVPRGSTPDTLNPESVASKSELRYLSHAMVYALHAAKDAVEDARWQPAQDAEKERTGVCVGMGMIDLQEVYDTGEQLKRGYSRVSPFFIPRILPNLAAGHISMRYGFQGPNHCASTACTTGLHGIGDAFRFIRHGDADVMVCGGTEAAINPLSIVGFARMRALSTAFNDDPASASRPFDKQRDGFVMGEGAGILVLEELSHAQSRNAKIYAEILGYGLSADANHITSPAESGQGAFLCMERALKEAQLEPSSISYVNCHATSTPLGDKAEMRAVRRLFGKHAEDGHMAISSCKGAIGHLLGAAGAVEAIFTVLACQDGVIPGTANLQAVDEETVGLRLIAGKGCAWERTGKRRIALKNSFGFGGTNASLCISEMVSG